MGNLPGMMGAGWSSVSCIRNTSTSITVAHHCTIWAQGCMLCMQAAPLNASLREACVGRAVELMQSASHVRLDKNWHEGDQKVSAR